MTYLLMFVLTAWQPGLIEQHTYKLGDAGIPGTSVYTLRGVILEGKKVLEVEVETHRVLSLGGQQGKLESVTHAFMDPETFDFIESRLTTMLNGAEASYLHSLRKGAEIQVYQKLRGSPPDTRTVPATGVVIDESAVMFYIERTDWSKTKSVQWQRYNAAQSHLQPNKASVDKSDADKLRIRLESDIPAALYDLPPGKPAVVTRIEAAGVEQMRLDDPPKTP